MKNLFCLIFGHKWKIIHTDNEYDFYLCLKCFKRDKFHISKRIYKCNNCGKKSNKLNIMLKEKKIILGCRYCNKFGHMESLYYLPSSSN